MHDARDTAKRPRRESQPNKPFQVLDDRPLTGSRKLWEELLQNCNRHRESNLTRCIVQVSRTTITTTATIHSTERSSMGASCSVNYKNVYSTERAATATAATPPRRVYFHVQHNTTTVYRCIWDVSYATAIVTGMLVMIKCIAHECRIVKSVTSSSRLTHNSTRDMVIPQRIITAMLAMIKIIAHECLIIKSVPPTSRHAPPFYAGSSCGPLTLSEDYVFRSNKRNKIISDEKHEMKHKTEQSGIHRLWQQLHTSHNNFTHPCLKAAYWNYLYAIDSTTARITKWPSPKASQAVTVLTDSELKVNALYQSSEADKRGLLERGGGRRRGRNTSRDNTLTFVLVSAPPFPLQPFTPPQPLPPLELLKKLFF
ncbi:hypothetical protein J6590_015144 [Homalodisca vitripennis]|nr:hypothetical protein J6590_015144 [Homalodisca vitripennis]